MKYITEHDNNGSNMATRAISDGGERDEVKLYHAEIITD